MHDGCLHECDYDGFLRGVYAHLAGAHRECSPRRLDLADRQKLLPQRREMLQDMLAFFETYLKDGIRGTEGAATAASASNR
jgi:hypothetical protein